MNLSHLARRVLVAVCFLVIPVQAFAQYKYLTRWSVEENQLITEEGGRANSVAVSPGDSSRIFVASDTGGLFKTVDGGMRWTHVDIEKLPVIFTQSVVYVNSDILLVSAKADYKTANGGGVWRSTNRGEDWTQVLGAVPNSSERLSAYEISMQPYSAGFTPIVVGTSAGVFVSEDGGQH